MRNPRSFRSSDNNIAPMYKHHTFGLHCVETYNEFVRAGRRVHSRCNRRNNTPKNRIAILGIIFDGSRFSGEEVASLSLSVAMGAALARAAGPEKSRVASSPTGRSGDFTIASKRNSARKCCAAFERLGPRGRARQR